MELSHGMNALKQAGSNYFSTRGWFTLLTSLGILQKKDFCSF